MINDNLILIVEDEPTLGETLREYLSQRDYPCHLATTCFDALEYFKGRQQEIKVILLDIGLPDGNGIDLAKTFRKESPNTVIFFLSALNDPNTRLKGLEIGADDYITKPFELKELTIRLDRVLKNQNELIQVPETVEIGDLKIQFKSYLVYDGNQDAINLSQKECEILKLLYLNMGEVISRDKIIDEVWGRDSFPSNRTVDNYIVKLRKWCETSKTKVLKITSIRGIGYKLEKDQ